ncbi:hypothetical protein TDB9533_01711 [Thalassocella blandensis]|nr:hypothetical protein TDB9533_01711 [Thalassocella blandensis]
MSKILIEQFKQFYADHEAMDLTALDAVYAEDVVFRDPLHTIRGLPALRDYLAAMYDNITECRFEYLDELIGESSAYIKWRMHFRHPKFKDKLITVRGVSQVQFDTKIIFHEDMYDVGEMIYDHVPVLGGVTRWLKAKIAQGSQAA